MHRPPPHAALGTQPPHPHTGNGLHLRSAGPPAATPLFALPVTSVYGRSVARLLLGYAVVLLTRAAVKETLLLLLRSVLPSVTRVTAADAVTSASDTDGPAPGGGEAHKRTFGHAIARLVAYFTISVLITHFMPQIFAKVGL